MAVSKSPRPGFLLGGFTEPAYAHMRKYVLMGQPTLTRREFAIGCSAGLAGRAIAASPHFIGIEINHVALRVSDLTRTEDFLREQLGSPGIIFEKPGQRYLRVGRNFTALFEKDPAGLDHFAISVEGYVADEVEQQCRALGLETRRSSDFVYVHGPDGIEVQIAHPEHEVHSPVVREPPKNSQHKGDGIVGVALRVTDVARASSFYSSHFGLQVEDENEQQARLKLGDNFLELVKADRPGLEFIRYSAVSGPTGEPDVLSSPDGIRMQVVG